MPPKTHSARSSNLQRTHSRSSSGGGSKVALNLHFTQKDPPLKQVDRKGKGLDTHSRTTSPYPQRANSTGPRAASKELLSQQPQPQPPLPQQQQQQQQPRRPTSTTSNSTIHQPPPAHHPSQPHPHKPKAGFTLASPNADEDDEWVSSESGAATPNKSDLEEDGDSDDDDDDDEGLGKEKGARAGTGTGVAPTSRTPVLPPAPALALPPPLQQIPQQHQQPPPPPPAPVPALPPPLALAPLQQQHPAVPSSKEEDDQPDTPRAELPRISTLRSSAPPTQPPAPLPQPPHPHHLQPHQPHHQLFHPHLASPLETRSETTSPVQRTHHAPHPLANGHGHARTRPPSTHSLSRGGDSAVPLRPHPLIRGQSFGPTPLAPLTITSGVSTSPTRSIHAGGGGVVGLSTSPSSISTALDDRRAGQVHQAPGRRTSVSSTRSVSTLPSQSSTAHYPSYPHAHSHLQGSKDRTRTLSTISSSSMAALSSLAQLPSTRPSTPQYVSRFPAQGGANLEVVHPLLPSPYLSAHVSILTYRSPLKESFGRVFAAKPQRR